jgi:adenine/guanine phosphoribosyltransferase-like PRPP-binding protein
MVGGTLVGFSFILELSFLNGRSKLKPGTKFDALVVV